MLKWLRLPYSIYAIIILFVLFIPALPIYIIIKMLVSYPKQQFWVHKVNRVLFLTWSAFTGWRYDIRGVKNIDFDQNYIAICNHTNLADFMASAYGIQIPGKPLVKKELLKVPIFGQLFAMASVPVDRKDEKARKKSLQTMISELEQGVSLIIFPEGTRNRTPEPLKSFHNGAFILAMKTGTPILPVAFTGVRNLSSAESMLIRPWKITCTHLAPIDPKNFDSMEEMKEHTFKTMWNFLVDHDEAYQSYDKL